MSPQVNTQCQVMDVMAIICKSKFGCDQDWSAMSPIDEDPSVRHCASCNGSVHRCFNLQELGEHVQQGHCVAFGSETDGECVIPSYLGESHALYLHVISNGLTDSD